VGFNPFRGRRRRPADIALVAAAFVVVGAFVAWAAFGG
jgi:hypothetical protein